MDRTYLYISICFLFLACENTPSASNINETLSINDTCSCESLVISHSSRSYNHPNSSVEYTGYCKTVYLSGNTKEIRPFYNGKVEGVIYEYYDNGNKKSEREFKENRQHGFFKQWKFDGSLEYYALYNNGRIDTVLNNN